MSTAAAVFDQNDDTGLVETLTEHPAAEHRHAVVEAISRCPARAITVTEDSTVETRRPDRTSGWLVTKTIIVDVGMPYAAYLALKLVGVSDVTALVVAGGVSVLRVGVSYIRHRRISALAMLVTARFALGILAGLLTGDARVVLLKDPIITAVMGAAILASLTLRRPLTFYIRRDFVPDGMSWDEAWDHSRAFRRQNRIIAAAWGAGLVGESVARVALVLTVPVQVAAVTSPLFGTTCVLLLFGWMNWYLRTQRTTTAEVRS
ncbi:VC0807 family protein [Nocardia sp. NBC_01329]|uniref:VC0807 family protein n=1 Tax=Nocardia sp. NBC_01329 TaxID=2903594 RepID=UPI002E0D697C|nr:hypothetical protein OG405_10905 [Nocardia sp. NBC_01329]